MSIQFDGPIDAEARAELIKLIGRNVLVDDGQNFLLSNENETILQFQMAQVANAAKQPVKVMLHDEGDVIEMRDGTKYRVTPNGWRKI